MGSKARAGCVSLLHLRGNHPAYCRVSFVGFTLAVTLVGLMAMYFSIYVMAMDGYPWRPDYLVGWALFIFFEGVASFIFAAAVRLGGLGCWCRCARRGGDDWRWMYQIVCLFVVVLWCVLSCLFLGGWVGWVGGRVSFVGLLSDSGNDTQSIFFFKQKGTDSSLHTSGLLFLLSVADLS